MSLHLRASRAYPVDVATTFDRLLPMPLPRLFRHAYGPIPPIAATDGPEPWGTVHEQRIVAMSTQHGPGMTA